MSKKFYFLIFLFIALASVLFLFKDNFIIFQKDLFENIKIIKQTNLIFFLAILIIMNFTIFLSPIPTTPFIIFNGYILGSYGFFLSYITIVICSFIIFKFVTKLKFIYSFKSLNKLREKIDKNKNSDLNFLIISASRYVFPYFFHNIFYGSILKRHNIFIISVIIAELPIIFLLNQFGKQIGEASKISNLIKFLHLIIL